MASARGSEILSGYALKQPVGKMARLLHSLENRYFILKLGAHNVPELTYYENEQSIDHEKGVLFLDHPGVSISVQKDSNQIVISNASKGQHDGRNHIVNELLIQFSSVAELSKWETAFQNCLHPKPHAGTASEQDSKTKEIPNTGIV